MLLFIVWVKLLLRYFMLRLIVDLYITNLLTFNISITYNKKYFVLNKNKYYIYLYIKE